MKSSLKVATERTAPRTPERQGLADAIVRRTAAEQAHEAGRRALVRAADAVGKAEAAVETARIRVTEAGERHACELAEAVAGGAPAKTGTTRAARAALDDAEHELAAAQSAYAKVRGSLAELEDQHLDASNRVTAGADLVLRASAEQALGEAETLALRLRALTPVLRFLVAPEITPDNALIGRHQMFGTDWDHEIRVLGRRHFAGADARRLRDAPFAELGAAIKRFLEGLSFQDAAWPRGPLLGPWHQARAAVMADPDAPLPGL